MNRRSFLATFAATPSSAQRSCRLSERSLGVRTTTGLAITTSCSSTRQIATPSELKELLSIACRLRTTKSKSAWWISRTTIAGSSLGESHSWSWHQGCMLQWLPGSKSEILWNDREGDQFVCHILDVKTKKRRTLPVPIYAIRPDARWAIATDFRRLYDVRPETGYAGVPDPNKEYGGSRQRRRLEGRPQHRKAGIAHFHCRRRKDSFRWQ